jgi:hypothetical protein
MEAAFPRPVIPANVSSGLSILLWMHNGLRYIYWQDHLRQGRA